MSDIKIILENLKKDNFTKKDLETLVSEYNIPIKSKKERLKDVLTLMSKKYVPYPSKDDKNFYKKIYKKKEFYENMYKLPEEKTDDIQKAMCPGPDKKFQLLSHQVVLRNYMNFNTPYNGVLLFHGMGSGKTCSSITIAESYKKSLVETSGKRTLVLVSGDTIEENFRNEIHNIKRGYNQCTFTDYMNYLPYDSDKVKQTKADNLIDKNYEIEHYQRFSNIIKNKNNELNELEFQQWIKQNYSGRVFIIDEVHNLKIKDKKDKEKKKDIRRYEAVLNVVKYSENMKLVLLSGTPMSHEPEEIVDIINLLLINDNFDTISKKDLFKDGKITNKGKELLSKISRGYISYLTKDNPYTFPTKIHSKNTMTISDFIEMKFGVNLFSNKIKEEEFKIIPCLMKDTQKRTYLNYLKEREKDINIQEIIQLGLISFNYKEKNTVFKIPFNNFAENKIEEYSTKFYQLLQNIKRTKGSIFIYTNYKDKGIFMIASMLLKNGIDIFNSRGKGANPIFQKKFLNRRQRPSDKNKLCATCLKQKSNDHKGHVFKPMLFDFIIGQTPDDVQKKIISTFNNPENFNGEKLKIIIGSSVLKEGVSFLRTRQLHIMEPWHNKSRLEQVIARGLRHCSHKDLKQGERNIEIFLYASVLSKEYIFDNKKQMKAIFAKMNDVFENNDKNVTVDFARSFEGGESLLSYDAIMYKRLEILSEKVKEVEQVIKEGSFDCALNKKLNIDSLTKDKQYNCKTFKNEDYDLKDDEIDISTYNNIFLTPYIKYILSFIKTHFETHIILYEDELFNNVKLQNKVYIQNKHYVLRKALQMVTPEKDIMKTFPHIINNGGNYGYIFTRKIGKKKVYIFKDFDDQKIFTRSLFEVSPIYEKIYAQPKDESKNSFKLFLNIIERKDKKQTNIYFNTLTSGKSGEGPLFGTKINATDLIKTLDPIGQHVNDGEYVAIKINIGKFKNKMWIRTTDNNKIKKRIKKDENLKQYSYGRECISAYDKKDLINITKRLWSRVDKNSKFYKEHLELYNKTNDNISPMKYKSKICDMILEPIFKYLQKNKVEGKVWLKILKT